MARTIKLVALGLVIWGLIFNLYLLGYSTCRDCIPLLAQVNNLAHFMTLTSILALVVMLVVYRRWWLGLWLLPGVVMFGIWFGQLWLPASPPDVEGQTLTVASYNVLGYEADSAEVVKLIQAMNADIVAVVELRPKLNRQIIRELDDEYPYQALNADPRFSLGLLSRYPFLERPSFRINRTPRYIRAVLDVDGQAVVVYVFHPPNPDFRLGIVYEDTPNLRDIRRLTRIIEAETLPTLLFCDCNTTPQSQQYAVLDEALVDTFKERGWGFGLTYPAYFPLIRIDYIWHSADFVALEAKVWTEGTGGTSDHLPVWGKLVLRQQTE